MGIFTQASRLHSAVKEQKNREAIVAAIRTQTENSLSSLFEMFGEDFTLSHVDFDFSSSVLDLPDLSKGVLELSFSFGVYPKGVNDERAVVPVDVVMIFDGNWNVKPSSSSLDLSSAGLYSEANAETRAAVLSAFWDEFVQ